MAIVIGPGTEVIAAEGMIVTAGGIACHIHFICPQQIEAGAIGLKLHEDWGATPSAIDYCLGVAEETHTQVSIHSDTLNEAGFVEDTIAAPKGCTLCAFHTEGAGGGHAPDTLSVVGAELSAVADEPGDALHREHGGRAPVHADGVPSPRRRHRRGPGLCREPHPVRDRLGRRHAARPGRDQHDEQ